jgi:hypothetical protein
LSYSSFYVVVVAVIIAIAVIGGGVGIIGLLLLFV